MRLWPLRRKPAGRPERARSFAYGGIVRGLPTVGEHGSDCGTIPSRPRPDATRIAILEFTELGLMPAPGTAAAAAVGMHVLGQRIQEAMGRPVDRTACPHDDVVEMTVLGNPRSRGVCGRCGAPAVEGDDGAWEFP